MEYINLFLILLTILLLSVSTYENFFICKNNYQSITTDKGSVCCPPNSSNGTWDYVNGLCCRNKITEQNFNKIKKKR